MRFNRFFYPSLGVLCTGLCVLFLHHGSYWSAHWASRWAILVGMASFWLAFDIGRENFFLGLTSAYLLLSAASVGVWPQNQYVGLADPTTLIAIEKSALYAFLVMILICVSFLRFKPSWKYGSYVALGTIFLASLINTLIHFKIAPQDGLFSGNPSMNGSLIAALLPFVLVTPFGGWLFIPLSVLVIYLTKTSIPLGVLGVALGAFMLSHFRPTVGRVIQVLLLALTLAVFGSFYLGMDLLDPNGRFHVWGEVINWHQKQGNILFGNGLGTSQILTPIIQSAAHPDAKGIQFFLWLHNEWLQILIETGILGLCLVVCSWILLLRKSYRSPALFASFCAFSFMALFNYPLRLPIHSFCLFLICCLIWKEDLIEK